MVTLIYLFSGLMIFFIGIRIMGKSLKDFAGHRLKIIIERMTNNLFTGILVGTLVTAILQSSSGTTAITISLMRYGLMTFPQAIGVIMGANIGTTITAFLIGLNIKRYSLYIIFLGFILYIFFRIQYVKLVGKSIMGFGFIFYGLKLLSLGLSPLATLTGFSNFIVLLSESPILGVFAGIILTMLIQSSSATIGILEELYATNVIEFSAAFPVLLGDNIGSTITSVLAALGGSVAAKRASAFHVLFNVIGTLIFLTLFLIFKQPIIEFVAFFETKFLSGFVEDGLEKPHLTIAFAHMFFNIMNTFMLVWFVNYLVRLVKFIIPSEDEDVNSDF